MPVHKQSLFSLNICQLEFNTVSVKTSKEAEVTEKSVSTAALTNQSRIKASIKQGGK